tara:strand:- start:131 stop:232 length:102 start_codon:yes stop_codon:yes gene_type:complete
MPYFPSKILEVFDNQNVERDFLIKLDISKVASL